MLKLAYPFTDFFLVRAPHPHPSGNSILGSYLPLKTLAFETPHPLGVSKGIFFGTKHLLYGSSTIESKLICSTGGERRSASHSRSSTEFHESCFNSTEGVHCLTGACRYDNVAAKFQKHFVFTCRYFKCIHPVT